jgi:hypothetical protein
MDADEKQFAVMYSRLKNHKELGWSLLCAEVDKHIPPDAMEEAKDILAKRQANAAVALLRLGQPDKVWPLLKHSPDPRARSYLIHRLGPLGADAGAVIKRLDEEPDVTIQRALVLSLGAYSGHFLSPGEQDSVVERLRHLYRNAADPGLHGAAEWLLAHWKQGQWLK